MLLQYAGEREDVADVVVDDPEVGAAFMPDSFRLPVLPLFSCLSARLPPYVCLCPHPRRPPLVARGVAEFLRARLPQLEVVVAGGADDLLRWVDERGTPAIALIDFWLAEGAAVSLVAQVRSLCPGTPIAVISGDDDPAVMQQARQAGAHGFIHKAGGAGNAGVAVEALLSGQTWFAPGPLGNQPPRNRDLPVTPAELGLSARQGEILALVLQGCPTSASPCSSTSPRAPGEGARHGHSGAAARAHAGRGHHPAARAAAGTVVIRLARTVVRRSCALYQLSRCRDTAHLPGRTGERSLARR